MLARNHFFLALSIGALLWGLSIPMLLLFFAPAASAAEFGDMFGAVNALFSGLALAGVVYTVLLQHEELRGNQKLLHDSIVANKQAALATAYGALLQEGHNALERYARWEKPGKRKYAGVQRTTRLHMARYRKALAALEAESKVASPQSTAP